MKVKRKFNLASIGKQYDSVTIEEEGNSIAEIILKIDEAFAGYLRAIQANLVR